MLFVDMKLLAVGCWAAEAVFFVDTDFFFVAGVAVVGWVDGGREGLVELFVTFPSDVRRLRR